MELAERPIGVFDSGVGGLSILREIHAELPNEDVLYVADQLWAPYGSRGLDEVRRRSVAVAAELIGRGAKLIVVACNSASAAALHHLRDVFQDTPFVGMEPALKPAASHTDKGVIGVLATETTFQGELYASVLGRHTDGVAVIEVAGTRLATLVEECRLDEAKADLEDLLGPMLDAGIDTLVLGCTHYPFLADQIREVTGPDVRLVDPAPAVARQVKNVLGHRQILNGSGGDTSYFTSAEPGRFEERAFELLGYPVNATRVEIEDQGTTH
ncbi:MAG: glutamate racemase [Acidimicrobiia bacterium]|nr:glutamate racemase [Acidimicrobiia bacterium]